jgi:hypothetical protein
MRLDEIPKAENAPRYHVPGSEARATVRSALTSRLPFLLAVALIAAAIADPVVESISNTGVFGGHYADDNHTGVIPTLLGGLLLVLEIVAARCISVLRRSPKGSRAWFVDVARGISSGSGAHDLPYAFGLQLAALFLLESSEQLLVGGKLLGGTAWLGGPIVFSLLTHALIGAGCFVALRRVLRALVTAFASLVGAALEFILLARSLAEPRALARRCDAQIPRRAQAPHVRQIGGRAPPLLQTA